MAESEPTFKEFKDSFAYGSRSDLSFKFLKNLGSDEAADFFQELLWEIGEAQDGGDLGRVLDSVLRWQVKAYAPRTGAKRRWVYKDAPFARLAKPLAESRLGLLTSSGHFVSDDDPEPFGVAGMTQGEAEARIDEFLRAMPYLSVIPSETATELLRVRHGGYDVRSVARDPNVAFPVDRLREAVGRVGGLASDFYSFVGATAQGRLRNEALPDWVRRIRDAGIDVLLLVPV